MESIRAAYGKGVIYVNDVFVTRLSLSILMKMTENCRFIALNDLIGSTTNLHSNESSVRRSFISKYLWQNSQS